MDKFYYMWSDEELDYDDEIYDGVYGEWEIQEN